MSKKKTIKEVSSIFENRGLHLCETEYKNNRTKMTCYDNDGYYYSLSLGNIMDLRNLIWLGEVILLHGFCFLIGRASIR